MRLEQLLESRARANGRAIAAVEPARSQTSYADLNRYADAVREALRQAGVEARDRVGICAGKSTATLAAIFGILKAGAAYVPTDATAPASRNAYILSDCACRAVVADRQLAELLRGELGAVYDVTHALDMLDPLGADAVLLVREVSTPGIASPEADLAYILYTSGSTGRPKGVMHTHASALAFVNWCSTELEPTADDCFSSHAPFHFDLSIFDIYVSIKHGARVVLIDEGLGKQPTSLAQVIADEGISVWYSTPSILRMLVEFGRLGELPCPRMRSVLFAGEVFPLKHLRALKDVWTAPVYYNLYGPTETNVCTYYRIPATISPDRTDPFPIGRACSDDRVRITGPDDTEVAAGLEGELLVHGGSVMQGYWDLPAHDAKAFYVDATGTRWYRTGDVVREGDDGEILYLGRRDRMVKRRGYRVELGEIEAALYQHPNVSESAVVAVVDAKQELTVWAFIVWAGEKAPSTIALKTFCAQKLPRYMVPDHFSLRDELPKTSTDKVDYQRLKDSL
jgi:amino acid adenylation domain-containing protein